jgi:hypothetical protein
VTNDRGTLGPEPDDLAEEVRRRLHEAVAEVRPAPDALDRLRVAVPARRRRRRAAMIGTAGLAAALIVATPMLRTAADSDGSPRSNISRTNSSAAVQNVTDPLPTPDGGVSAGVPGDLDHSAPPSGQAVTPTGTGGSVAPTGGQSGTGHSAPPATAPASSAPPASTPPAPPACQATELFGEDALLGALGPDGLAYGVLQVRSNAAKDCVVAGPGVVVVASPPGNPVVQVSVVQHVRGDVAKSLPEPASSTSGITLKRGQSYEFQFAWQPLAPGADGTCAADAPQAPVPALGYTLASGDFNVAKVALTSTCGGTLYRTDIYRTGEHPRVG